LGNRATLQYIEKAGHLAQMERPCVYNKRLKEILATLVEDGHKKQWSFYRVILCTPIILELKIISTKYCVSVVNWDAWLIGKFLVVFATGGNLWSHVRFGSCRDMNIRLYKLNSSTPFNPNSLILCQIY